MYAVVNTGGKQARVEQGSIIAIEHLDAEVGNTVSLPVIFVADGERVLATPSEISGIVVTAEVLEHFKGDKKVVFKFKKRKGYKRTKGHRQVLTSVRIVDIALDGKPAPKAEKKATPKAETAAPKAEKPVEKAATKAEKPAAKAEKGAVKAEVEAGMCAAKKADGSPCTNKAKDGSKYCGVHAKKLEG